MKKYLTQLKLMPHNIQNKLGKQSFKKLKIIGYKKLSKNYKL
uniref:Cytochrome b6-f complex subunit PetP n=1 Tax=Polysiphonia sp. TaxID=1967842 RepID=A0A1Z1MTE4_9FLOR|nr:cytochrome b6-f complex subunit PetP [Polysiphonia sp.]